MFALLLVAFPLFLGILTLLFKGNAAKWVSFIGSLFPLALVSYVLFFNSDDASYLFKIKLEWIPSLGIGFHLGLDGVALILILLTNVLVPFILLSSFENRVYSNLSHFYGLILLMQSALVGVFSSLDAFLFYVFWEAALIPVYLISGIWGGEDKVRVTFKFFIYTIFGSLFMLIGIIYIYLQTPAPHSFDWNVLTSLQLDATQEFWIFLSFLLAFAIKMPIFPFHTWQPDTYTVTPTPATMLLGGIMLKMGIFGIIRWIIPITPFAFTDWNFVLTILSVIGIVYASIIALLQKDFKRLMAYSSIAHVGLIAAGLFSGNIEGIQGAIIQMFNHGINLVGIFFILEIVAQRTGTRQISELGGIVHTAPKLAIVFVIIMLGSVALPLTNGFAGEFLLLLGVYKYNMYLGAFAGLTIILGAVYMLRMYKNVMLGEANAITTNFKDLTLNELAVLVPICIIVIGLGLFPNVLLQFSEPAAMQLVNILAK